jgi:hypothetical protein
MILKNLVSLHSYSIDILRACIKRRNLKKRKKMKRFLLTITILVSGLTIFAQDIIVTKDAKRIDAKVLEINIDNVRYKDSQNPDGPIYTILKSDIASIVYENGQVETFSNQPAPVTQPVQQTQNPNVQQNPQNLTAKQFGDMDDKDIEEYLRKNEGGEIYETFHSGMKLRSSGKKMLTAGLVLASVGLATSIIGYVFMEESYSSYYNNYYYDDYFTAYAFFWTGVALGCVGEGLIIASIPLNAIGGSKKRNAKNNYIDQYINEWQNSFTPTLNFNYTGSGLGLVLKF